MRPGVSPFGLAPAGYAASGFSLRDGPISVPDQ